MIFRRVNIRDSVVEVIYHEDDAAPLILQAHLQRALQRLFPADTMARLSVDLAWSGAEAAWHLRRAVTTRGGVSVTVTDSLRVFLGQAGIAIAPARGAGTPLAAHAAGADNRRTPRIPRSVPLRVETEQGAACDARSAVINAHGALLLSPEALPDESRLRITNLERGESGPFRVVWCGGPAGDLHEVGVELLAEEVDFWGPAYRIGTAG